MTWVFVIADDLTGALEIGARFAGRGFATRVTTQLPVSDRPDVSVLVIDTETRHLPEETAAAIIRETATSGLRFSPDLVYKKTDSTLRGNISAELGALLDVMPERSIVYVPAYPEMGRTVRNARLFVWGIPAHETEFAFDTLNPVQESHIPSLLKGLAADVRDGESNEHVMEVARTIVAMEPSPIAAGPAALAGALAECLALPRQTIQPWPKLSRCLVINGSRHPASAEQILYAQQSGCFDDGWQYLTFDVEATGTERARQVGESVKQYLATMSAEGLVVFGGDTAYGIHSALGATPFEPYGELLPGVPLSRCGGHYWITKAGGFGSRELLCDIRKLLT